MSSTGKRLPGGAGTPSSGRGEKPLRAPVTGRALRVNSLRITRIGTGVRRGRPVGVGSEQPCVSSPVPIWLEGVHGIRIASMSVNFLTKILPRFSSAKPERVEPPPIYQVMILNDDYTPMEFVVMVLQQFFSKDADQAFQIMWKVHIEGKGSAASIRVTSRPPRWIR